MGGDKNLQNPLFSHRTTNLGVRGSNPFRNARVFSVLADRQVWTSPYKIGFNRRGYLSREAETTSMSRSKLVVVVFSVTAALAISVIAALAISIHVLL